jgi:hypothetical protein
MKKYFIYIVCLLFFSCSKKNDLPINNTPQPNPIVVSPPTKNTNIPKNGEIGGINYAYWTFNSTSITKMVHTFTIHNEPMNMDSSLNKDGIYYQFYQGIMNDTIGFYYGIQTNTGNKKGIIFSRWKTRDITNYKIANGGWGQSAGYEGDFIGVRIEYEWVVGTYTIELRKDSTDSKGDWYGLWIKKNSDNKNTYCGSIRFETSSKAAGMKGNGITWTELYFKANVNTPLPKWHVSVDEILGDNIAPQHVWVTYSKNVFVGFSNIYTTNKKDVHFSMGPDVLKVTPESSLW